jgi:hypothetical protein
VTDDQRDATGNEQPTEVRDSNPNAGGGEGTDGEKDTTEPAHRDQGGDLIGSDAEFEAEPEDNPEGLDPKAGYPSRDPRSDDLPFKDA